MLLNPKPLERLGENLSPWASVNRQAVGLKLRMASCSLEVLALLLELQLPTAACAFP